MTENDRIKAADSSRLKLSRNFSTGVLTLAILTVPMLFWCLKLRGDLQPYTQRPQSCSSTTTTYFNPSLGIGFRIPPGFHLAKRLMQFLSAVSLDHSNLWSPANASAVIITESDDSVEAKFIESASSSISFTNVTSLPLTIYISVLDIDEADAIRELNEPYQSTTIAGLNAIRYVNLAGETVIAVPHHRLTFSSVGARDQTIFIKMKSKSGTLNSALESMTNSFCID